MAKNKHYQQIVMNIKPDLVRNDTMMGKTYTVVPMVMMVEGVLAGNCGPIMYPFKEMASVPQIWNSKPVVVYHPESEDAYGSACTPEELTARSIGTIMNTAAVPGGKNKLTAEAWLDPDRIDLVDNRIAEAIKNKTMMELSTGLYMDVEDTPGTFNEVEYDGIASNFRPDHLALLPDITGASSIEDGAGFIRVNMKFDKTEVNNELSDNDRRSQLQNLVRQTISEDDNDWIWIEDVFSEDSFFVYERDNKLYKQEFGTESDGTTLKLVGLPIAVVRVMTYELVKNEAKGNNMDKKKVVDGLISNKATQWTEEDRETLMGMNEDALGKMAPKVIEVVKTPEEIAEAAVQNAAEEGAADLGVVNSSVDAPPKVMTVKEHISGLPKPIQEVLNHGLATYNEKRKKLVATIMANERNVFKEDFLKTKDIKELQAIANLCEPVVNEDTRFDFSANGPIANANEPTTEKPLTLPTTFESE